MIPIVTPSEMRVIDAAARHSHDVLVARAGAAVARCALRMLGGTYGRSVVVLAGPGSNGADGRVAARLLAARGVRVSVIDVGGRGGVPERIDTVHPTPVHLVVDAVYGTGFRDAWTPPAIGDARVLAVDIPSGVDATTGEVRGGVLRADVTVTFAALKPGLLLGAGRALCGRVEVVPPAVVGLDDAPFDDASARLVEASDVADGLVWRPSDAHKWRSAVRVVAGSPGMPGAAALVGGAALRAGSGMVHLSSPHGLLAGLPHEVVQVGGDTLDDLRRFGSLVVGPGLGRSDATRTALDDALRAARAATVPVVIDGDGLWALSARATSEPLGPSVVVTPHDGEFERLAGAPVDADRIGAARRLAARLGCTVLLKGPATVTASPEGQVLVSTSGDQRLATAGSGDVLSGIVAALLATGVEPLQSAAFGAWLHGAAGALAPAHGMMASDLIGVLPEALDAVAGERR